MDIEVLRKKISTFRGADKKVRITDDHLYMEILFGWEQWKGSSKEFYKAIGVSKSGLAAIIGKAKRMRREGHFPSEDFKEIKAPDVTMVSGSPCGIEVAYKDGKIIRFSQVSQLVEFLRQAS